MLNNFNNDNDEENHLIVLETDNKDIVGVFISDINDLGLSYVFSIKKDNASVNNCYNALNDNDVLLVKQDDLFSIGDKYSSALTIDSGIKNGSTTNCLAFNSEPLTDTDNFGLFYINNLELFRFKLPI